MEENIGEDFHAVEVFGMTRKSSCLTGDEVIKPKALCLRGQKIIFVNSS